GPLGGGEAGPVAAVVDGVVHPLVDGVDALPQRGWVEGPVVAGDGGEGAVEHADDVGGFIADDGVPLPVPEHRHRGAAFVAGVRLQVQLVEVVKAVAWLAVAAEFPAVLQHQRANHTDADVTLEALQHPEDQGAVGPGAGQGDVQMVAPALRRKAPLAAGAGAAVGGYPVAKAAVLADEFPRAGPGGVPPVPPLHAGG